MSRSVAADPRRTYRTGGKANLDKRIRNYNRAALQTPWFALRDADHDATDCPKALRELLVPPASQSDGMCFRLAVRSLEAWLLADAEAFAETFSVAVSAVPGTPEQLSDPKGTVVNLCRRSRKSVIKKAVAPPVGSAGRVGPEYVTYISEYARGAWRPDVAAANAPSLARALREIERLVAEGFWR